jgi:hypothetical protein
MDANEGQPRGYSKRLIPVCAIRVICVSTSDLELPMPFSINLVLLDQPLRYEYLLDLVRPAADDEQRRVTIVTLDRKILGIAVTSVDSH